MEITLWRSEEQWRSTVEDIGEKNSIQPEIQFSKTYNQGLLSTKEVSFYIKNVKENYNRIVPGF